MTGGIRPLELRVGHGPAAPGAHGTLALKIVALAWRMGFSNVCTQVSRVRHSDSHYVLATCPAKRRWKIRISSHRRPGDAQIPHLDLISRDGIAGIRQASGFLGAVLRGERPWWDVRETGRQVSHRQRKHWGRR